MDSSILNISFNYVCLFEIFSYKASMYPQLL